MLLEDVGERTHHQRYGQATNERRRMGLCKNVLRMYAQYVRKYALGTAGMLHAPLLCADIVVLENAPLLLRVVRAVR